jgi:hypothetical protein
MFEGMCDVAGVSVQLLETYDVHDAIHTAVVQCSYSTLNQKKNIEINECKICPSHEHRFVSKRAKDGRGGLRDVRRIKCV